MSKKSNLMVTSVNVRLQLKEFILPPVDDALVLGKNSPIGSTGMHKALSLLNGTSFERIEIDDDVISSILIRTNLLKRLSKERLIQLVRDRVKPCMSPEEVLHLDLEVTLHLDEQL